MGLYTWIQCSQIRTSVEKDLEAKGRSLAKSAAYTLQVLAENDIEHGGITKEQLFDRNYKLIADNAEAKLKKYGSAFDQYTDEHWQRFVDSFLVDSDIVFAIPVAYSSDPAKNGYLPTHNGVFKDRSKRIFNDATGAAAAANTNPEGLKQVYQRDTGETMWDISYPIFIQGQHWGGYRVAVSIKQAEAKIAAAQKQVIFLMIGILIVMSAILVIVTGVVVGRPLSKIITAAENLASGDADLTTRLALKGQDELGTLAQAFNSFIDKIHSIVKKVDQSIELVAATSDNLSNNADGVARGSQAVASSVEQMVQGTDDKMRSVNETREIMGQFTAALNQIAGGAHEQAENVNRTSTIIAQMAETIQDVASNAEAVLGAAADSATVARKGEDAVESTISGMEKIKETVYESAVSIRELGEQSQKIGEIIQVIDDIAEQTNLLALNAAIEAARAGEHGKGFAVVADEVRKLAERSGRATKEIAELIGSIQSGTSKAVDAMEQGTREVEEGVKLAHDAGDALQEIIKTAEQVLGQIELISEAARKMNENSSSVVMAMDNVAAITEENSAATEQMAAGSDSAVASIDKIAMLTEDSAEHAQAISQAVEEMAASTEDIAEAAQRLSGMAHDLKTLVKGFKI